MVIALLLLLSGLTFAQVAPPVSGNPVLPGWYADPEAHVFGDRYWIYPTYSAPYGEQTFMDVFSSTDLVTWTKHPRVLDIVNVKWAKRAVWAPSVIEKGGWYYLFLRRKKLFDVEAYPLLKEIQRSHAQRSTTSQVTLPSGEPPTRHVNDIIA